MILVIDNFDSFTYNLVQFAGTINPNIKIIKNNECNLDDLKQINIEDLLRREIIKPNERLLKQNIDYALNSLL